MRSVSQERNADPMKVTPCKDCPDREIACQTKCEKYKAFKADLKKRKDYVAAGPVDMYLADAKRSKKRR